MSTARVLTALFIIAAAAIIAACPSQTDGSSQEDLDIGWGTIKCGDNWSYEPTNEPAVGYIYDYDEEGYTGGDEDVLTVIDGTTSYELFPLGDARLLVTQTDVGIYFISGGLFIPEDFVLYDLYGVFSHQEGDETISMHSFVIANTYCEMYKSENSSSLEINNGTFSAYGQLNLTTYTYNDGVRTGTMFYTGSSTDYVEGHVVEVNRNKYLEILEGITYTNDNSIVYCEGSSLITNIVIGGKYLNDEGTESRGIITWTDTLVSSESYAMFSKDIFDYEADTIVFKNTSDSQLSTSMNCIVFSEGKSVDARYSDTNDRWIHIYSSGTLEAEETITETTVVVDENTVEMFALFESEQFNDFVTYQSDCLEEIAEYSESHPEIAAGYTQNVKEVGYDLYAPEDSMDQLESLIESFREEVNPGGDIIEVSAGTSVMVKNIIITAISKTAKVDQGTPTTSDIHVFVVKDGSVEIDDKKYSNSEETEVDLIVDQNATVYLNAGTVTAYNHITINEILFKPGASGATLDTEFNLTSGSVTVQEEVRMTVSKNVLLTESESEIAFGDVPMLVRGEVSLENKSSVTDGAIQFTLGKGPSYTQSEPYVSISSDKKATFGSNITLTLTKDAIAIPCVNSSQKEVKCTDTEILYSLLTGFEEYKYSCAERARSYHTAVETEETKALIDRYAGLIENETYDVSVSDDDNRAAVQKILQELVVKLGVDFEFYFNDERDTRIILIESLHSAGESSEVRAYLNDTVAALSAMIYDHSLSLDDNMARLSEYEYEAVVEYIYKLNLAEFKVYVSNIDAKITAEMEYCDCYNEKQLIEDYRKMVTSLEYNREQGIKYNTDQVDLLYDTFTEKLTEYRPSAASFDIHLKNAIDYVEGCDDMGLKEVKSLKTDYSGKLRALTFDSSAPLEQNMSRIDSLVDSFDSQYTKVAANAVNSHKDEVLRSMNSEMDNAKNDDMREIVERYTEKLSQFRYDSSISYSDNIAYINGLYDLMKKELSHIEDNLSSRFDGYRAAYAASFRERIQITENPDAVAILESGISQVYSMKYDYSLTLDQNRLRLDNLACDVQKKLKELESTVVEAQFEEYRQKALNYISSKVVDGGNASTEECIESYKAEVLAVQYDLDKTPEENQKVIQDILERYDRAITEVASQSLFDSAKSQLAAYLETEFGSYPEIRTELDECCGKLKDAKYDESLSEEENIDLLQRKTAGYIEELDEALKTAENEESAAYRKEMARAVESYRGTDDSETLKGIIDQFVKRVNDYSIDGKSLPFNKYNIDSIVHEFINAYEKQIVAEKAEDFAGYVSDIKTKIEQKHTDDESEDMKTAIDNAYAKADSLMFDPLATVEENRERADRILSNLEEDLSILKIADETALKTRITSFVKDGKETISGFDEDLKTHLATILVKIEAVATSSEELGQRIIEFVSLKNEFEDGMRIQDSIDTYNVLRETYIEEAEYEHMVNESSAVKIILNNYTRSLETFEYSIEQSEEANISNLDTLRSNFLDRLKEQRLNENALVIGDLNQDRTSTAGGNPEYPKGCTEIWGTVSNDKGMSNVSVSMTRSNEDFPSDLSGCVNSGRFYILTGDGNMSSPNNMDALCSFDIMLKEGTKTFNSFTGTYEVSILLPEDLRAYQKFQVVCFDEYGDMQVLDCRVEGNFLIFTTTHFSEFTLFGINIAPGSFTLNELIVTMLVVMVILAALLLLMTRSIRYDPNGGDGKMDATFFILRTHSRLDKCCFVREGYTFAGWEDDSGRTYSDLEPIDSIGRFRHITLHAVWEADE